MTDDPYQLAQLAEAHELAQRHDVLGEALALIADALDALGDFVAEHVEADVTPEYQAAVDRLRYLAGVAR